MPVAFVRVTGHRYSHGQPLSLASLAAATMRVSAYILRGHLKESCFHVNDVDISAFVVKSTAQKKWPKMLNLLDCAATVAGRRGAR